MSKKVKVEYDVDNIMTKNQKKKNKQEKKQLKTSGGGGRFGVANVVALGIVALLEGLFYYFVTPPINIHVAGFWIWLAITVFAVLMCFLDYKSNNFQFAGSKSGKSHFAGRVFGILLAICVGVPVIGGIVSSPIFNSGKYASIIELTEGDFSVDVPQSETVENIALMDTDSARIIGNRAIGSLVDVVSQYQVSEDYSTIDYNGVPMKVASLEYAGFFKYMNNRNNGIPGYVLVDPVKNEAKYVKLQKPMMYATSACFNQNLQRHVQLSYPMYQFYGYYFELDNDGNPYYICPVLEPNAGLFGAKDVKGVVICDPCSGDCEYKDVADVPNWVDRVYDGDLATQKYNWYGKLSGGYINSLFGNKGCKVTTDDYGYKVMDGDVWVYTGVTSVNGDQSNIGFVLMNSRTGESKYFSIAGAEEHSAMSSAEGQVQNLGYVASFPSLININDVPTYILVLKDNAGLVKMYALVNVEKYNIVATGKTQKEALANYKKLLAENGAIDNTEVATEDMPSKRITVADIKYIEIEDECFVYITDKNGNVYKQAFAENESLIFIQEEDVITVTYMEAENGIHSLISYEK
ncbi:MAG: hypothetical protein ACI4EK_00235 [Wujia sp.]